MENAKKLNWIVRLPKFFVDVVWWLGSFLWPFINRLLCLDVGFQFWRAVINWNSQGWSGAETLAIHFAILLALTIFFINYKPNRK